MNESMLREMAEKNGVIFPEVQMSENPEDNKPLSRYGKLAFRHLTTRAYEKYVEYLMDGTLMRRMHQIENESNSLYASTLREMQKALPSSPTAGEGQLARMISIADRKALRLIARRAR